MTTIATLLITNVSLLSLEYYYTKKDTLEKIEILGDVIADRSKDALTFQDREQIKSNLKALEADEDLVRACMYDVLGVLVTQHTVENNSAFCDVYMTDYRKFKATNFLQESTVLLDKQSIGHLYIEIENKKFIERIYTFFLYSIVIMLLALFSSFFMINKLKMLISTPLKNLGEAINSILNEKDYSIRASKEHEDELGRLVDTFNNMLSTIEDDNDAIKESEDKFRTLTTLSPVGIFQFDPNHNIIYTNNTWEEINHSKHRIRTIKEWLDKFHQDDIYPFAIKLKSLEDNQKDISVESRIRAGFNEVKWLSIQISCLYHADGSIDSYLGSVNDISELKKAQLQLENLAFYDPLTGLANRRLFKTRLEQLIKHAQEKDINIALLFLDLDNFKKVNDTLGHNYGDALLKEISTRLKNSVRDTDTVSRIGGDEFTILLNNITNHSDISHVAQKILTALQQPTIVGDQEIANTVSIGITLAPKDSGDINTLMKNADLAMYKAKDAGKNTYRFFSEEMNLIATEHVELENELNRALENNQFMLMYQPKMCLSDKKVIGLEALIRWIHPTKGFIPPDKFIPVAEETGSILSIGKWVLEQSCQTMRTLIDEQLLEEDCKIAVNLSAKQFNDPTLLTSIMQILAQTELPHECLELEITESTLMDNVDQAIAIMQALKEGGISIAIDDFGTGYSSLNYIKKFPIDILKVDRSFVMDIPRDRNDEAITAAVIAMSQKLNLKVVAEGVETEEQMNFLINNNCDYGQGYFFSRPLSLEQLKLFLADPEAYKPE